VCSTRRRTPASSFRLPLAQRPKGGPSRRMHAWAITARLPYLGPAFGTKFLYFCSSTGRRSALILDRLVARWLRENVGLAFNEVRWSVSTYTRYLATMVGWADVLALAADQLEVCIFSAQARLGDTQWAFS